MDFRILKIGLSLEKEKISKMNTKSQYTTWIMFTKKPEYKDVYICVGIEKLGGFLDCLDIENNVFIENIYPSIEDNVVLRIYWRKIK